LCGAVGRKERRGKGGKISDRWGLLGGERGRGEGEGVCWAAVWAGPNAGGWAASVKEKGGGTWAEEEEDLAQVGRKGKWHLYNFQI
jgi:hypothetical protein